MVTGSQLRAARGLLNLSIAELAEETGLAINTIRRAEGTNEAAPITAANLNLLVRALGANGIEFLEAADGVGEGVRFRSADRVPLKARRRDKK